MPHIPKRDLMQLQEDNRRLRVLLGRAVGLLLKQQEVVAPLLGPNAQEQLEAMRRAAGELVA